MDWKSITLTCNDCLNSSLFSQPGNDVNLNICRRNKSFRLFIHIHHSRQEYKNEGFFEIQKMHLLFILTTTTSNTLEFITGKFCLLNNAKYAPKE
ncbi:hypothetical protein G9A89_003948 [Geosiphon pyriformis]|nr:hypothetical protein G9A89_003948 [Geosiphon pyriformis]